MYEGDGIMIKKLPKSFFEKERQEIAKESRQDITPIKWNKEVMSGKEKVKFELPSPNK